MIVTLLRCALRRYDNEYGYSMRVVDLINYIYTRDHPQ